MRFKSSIVFASAFIGLMFAADPWVGIGTWKINLEKSKLANPAAFKGAVNTTEAAGNHTFRITEEGPNGKRVTTFLADGKEHPLENSPGESRITQHLDERHSRTVFKKDGKELQTLEVTFSPDGKTRTAIRKGTGNNGKPLPQPWIEVWERQ
jgi:hypothetical protein